MILIRFEFDFKFEYYPNLWISQHIADNIFNGKNRDGQRAGLDNPDSRFAAWVPDRLLGPESGFAKVAK